MRYSTAPAGPSPSADSTTNQKTPEHVAVRRQQRVFDHVAQHLGARQFAGVEVAPFGQALTRQVLVAAVERVADVGEVVAELTKTQREVQHPHVDGQCQQQAVVLGQQVQGRHQQCRAQHRHAPHHPGVARLARIEVAPGPSHPDTMSCTPLSRGSGLSCSISSANRTAKKLIVFDDRA
jgi:hypothetical protein